MAVIFSFMFVFSSAGHTAERTVIYSSDFACKMRDMITGGFTVPRVMSAEVLHVRWWGQWGRSVAGASGRADVQTLLRAGPCCLGRSRALSPSGSLSLHLFFT